MCGLIRETWKDLIGTSSKRSKKKETWKEWVVVFLKKNKRKKEIIPVLSHVKFKQKPKRSNCQRVSEATRPIWLQTGCVTQTPKLHRTLRHISRLTPAPTINAETFSSPKGGLWGVKDSLALLLGPGAPRVLSGISVVFQQVKRMHTQADTIHTRQHYRVTAQRLYASCLSHWTTARQLCLHTHAHTRSHPDNLNRKTSVAFEGECLAHLFDQFDWLPSWDPNHIDFFLVNMFAFFQEDVCVYRHNTPIFRSREFHTSSISTSLWSGTKTEHQAKLSQPYHNALLITTAQSDSLQSLRSLEGDEAVDNKRRPKSFGNRLMIKPCKNKFQEPAASNTWATDYIFSFLPLSKALNIWLLWLWCI